LPIMKLISGLLICLLALIEWILLWIKAINTGFLLRISHIEF
jgi:hypothetical protein